MTRDNWELLDLQDTRLNNHRNHQNLPRRDPVPPVYLTKQGSGIQICFMKDSNWKKGASKLVQNDIYMYAKPAVTGPRIGYYV
jgi:hypothetical protein